MEEDNSVSLSLQTIFFSSTEKLCYKNILLSISIAAAM